MISTFIFWRILGGHLHLDLGLGSALVFKEGREENGWKDRLAWDRTARIGWKAWESHWADRFLWAVSIFSGLHSDLSFWVGVGFTHGRTASCLGISGGSNPAHLVFTLM